MPWSGDDVRHAEDTREAPDFEGPKRGMYYDDEQERGDDVSTNATDPGA